MINAIRLDKLRNADYIQFNKDFATVVSRNNPATLLVQPQYNALLAKITELETLFMTATGNPMTAELEALDHRRDCAVNGLVWQVKSFCNHYDTGMIEAATLLQNNLNLYGGGIADETYQKETAVITNLLADWHTKPELQNAVDMLGLLEWSMELKTINDEFAAKYIDRAQEYGNASPETLKGKRAETMEVYYALRTRLQSYADIEGTPLYTTTINELNAVIELYNTLVKRRTHKEVQPS